MGEEARWAHLEKSVFRYQVLVRGRGLWGSRIFPNLSRPPGFFRIRSGSMRNDGSAKDGLD